MKKSILILVLIAVMLIGNIVYANGIVCPECTTGSIVRSTIHCWSITSCSTSGCAFYSETNNGNHYWEAESNRSCQEYLGCSWCSATSSYVGSNHTEDKVLTNAANCLFPDEYRVECRDCLKYMGTATGPSPNSNNHVRSTPGPCHCGVQIN